MPISFQLDTGARCNVMSLNTLECTNLNPKLQPSDAPLKSYSGHMIDTVGMVYLPCVYKGQMTSVKFYIVDGDVQSVLGAKTCQTMGLVKRIHTVSPRSILMHAGIEHNALPDNIEEAYPDLFKGLGCLPGRHSIKIDKSVMPVIHPPKKIPIALKDKVKTELDRMEQMGVIIKQNQHE